jgi:hypothetical protein
MVIVLASGFEWRAIVDLNQCLLLLMNINANVNRQIPQPVYIFERRDGYPDVTFI